MSCLPPMVVTRIRLDDTCEGSFVAIKVVCRCKALVCIAFILSRVNFLRQRLCFES